MRTAIVGAGISGSYLAYLLSKEGRDVVLFDPKAPWEKPCGGGITLRVYRDFPILRDFREHCLPVESVTMFDVKGESCTVSCSDALLIASRQSLGEYLLTRTRSGGARLIQERVIRVVPHGKGWRVYTEERDYDFDVLVGGDGAKSLVRKTLVGPISSKDMTLSVGYWIKGDFPGEVVIGFVPGLSGYIWCFPRKGHVSLGIGARVGEATGRILYTHLDDFIERHFPDLKKKHPRRYAALIPSLTAEGFAENRICGDNWALVGDAAGLVDPLTGEGIGYAFESAEYAYKALKGGRLKDYETFCREKIFPDLCRAASYVKTFFRPQVTARLVTLAKEQPAVQRLLVNLITGNQDYLSLKKELLKILPAVSQGMLLRIFQNR
jgi:geranylgeranyl reductase family protein